MPPEPPDQEETNPLVIAHKALLGAAYNRERSPGVSPKRHAHQLLSDAANSLVRRHRPGARSLQTTHPELYNSLKRTADAQLGREAYEERTPPCATPASPATPPAPQ